MDKITRRALLGSMLVFLLIGGAAVWVLLDGDAESAWFSPADQPRPWAQDEWDELHRSLPGVWPGGAARLGRLAKLEWTEKEFKLEFPSAADGFEWPTEVIGLSDAGGFDDGRRSARVEWLAIARPDGGGGEARDGTLRVPFRLIDPVSHEVREGRELGEQAVRFGKRTAYFHSDGNPWLGIGMVATGFDQPHWDAIRVYDARTRVRVNGNTSYSVTGDGVFAGSSEVAVWHPAPMLVALDLLHGPVHSAVIPFEKDAVVEIGDARMRVVEVREAASSQSWSRGGGGRGGLNHASISTSDASERATYLVVEHWPIGQFDGMTWRVLDTEGRSIHVNSHCHDGDPVGVYSIAAARDQIQSVELTLRTRRTRFLVDLREIPGLPEENRGVGNLFEVKVPWFNQISDDWALRETITDLVQCKSHGGTMGTGGGLPTRPAAGSTPADLADLWVDGNPGEELIVPPGTGEIHFGGPSPTPGLFGRLSSVLRRLMP